MRNVCYIVTINPDFFKNFIVFILHFHFFWCLEFFFLWGGGIYIELTVKGGVMAKSLGILALNIMTVD